MVKLTINQRELEVEEGTTILQACDVLGLEIPHFCYHSRLSIAGNCRLCLVEVERSAKPVASCAMPVSEGMVVHTHTPKVEAARHGVLEFLLINHPLDCPICDQAGECDLQDLTLNYGRGTSRFALNKRAVRDKHMGPLIKTIMTRCIHCTRCIRFATEIAGVPELGTIGRGEHMEITSYLEKTLTSELSANVIDICPVGALTNHEYAFKGRPWELTSIPSIDVSDAVGSNIVIGCRGTQVMRILPRLHEEINEEWISDKTRFAFDGLHYQRLDQPYVRKRGKLHPVSWTEALDHIRVHVKKVPGHQIAALAGDLVDCEAMMALKDLMEALGSPHLDCRLDGSLLETNHRWSYLFNTTIAGIEKADACLLIGTNPRHEGTLINARLRKRYLQGTFPVGLIGSQVELTYPYEWIGDGAQALKILADKKHEFFTHLHQAERPMLILGQGALNRRDSWEILRLAESIARETGMFQADWNGFNVLHTAAGRVGGLELGFVPQNGGLNVHEILNAVKQGDIKVLYLLGMDEATFEDKGEAFVIYQGHHGDRGAHMADVVLPGAAYTEKEATYVNTEGRPQRTLRAVLPPGDAKEDWRILRALSEALDQTLPYDTLKSVRERLVACNPVFREMNGLVPALWSSLPTRTPETLSQLPFKLPIEHFHMTDVISRHSPTMAKCMQALQEDREGMRT